MGDEVVPVPETRPDDGVDVSLIRWMLSLTPGERLDVLQGFVDSVAELSGEKDRAVLPILRRTLEESGG